MKVIFFFFREKVLELRSSYLVCSYLVNLNCVASGSASGTLKKLLYVDAAAVIKARAAWTSTTIIQTNSATNTPVNNTGFFHQHKLLSTYHFFLTGSEQVQQWFYDD